MHSGCWLGLGQEHGGIRGLVFDFQALGFRLLSVGWQLLWWIEKICLFNVAENYPKYTDKLTIFLGGLPRFRARKCSADKEESGVEVLLPPHTELLLWD